MKIPFIRTPFNYDTNQAGDESGLKCLDKSRTAQEFAKDVDINTIVGRFIKTGEMPEDARMVFHGDFTEVTDFRGAQDLIVRAREAFDALPAAVRARFDHDAAKFVDFTSDDKNFDEAEALGLVRPEVAARRATERQEARNKEVEAAAAELLKNRSESVVEAPKGRAAKSAKDQSST